MSIQSFLMCRAFARSDNRRDRGLSTPPDIRRFDGIPYGAVRPWQTLDVYRPAAAEGQRLPVIVSVHGGGWVYGDKERYQYYCMNLAQRGFAVVNFSYRLAPRHRFPAPLEDTCAVFAWTLAHAEEYGLDPERVFAVGDSAGAHLLGLFLCMCVRPDFAARFPFAPPQGFLPRAVALNCGVYTSIPGKGGLTGSLLRDFLPGGGTPEERETIDVIRQMGPGFPPVFLMTAEADFLRDQAPVMQKKLAELQVPCQYRDYHGDGVQLAHVFHLNIREPNAIRCNDEECAFFREIGG